MPERVTIDFGDGLYDGEVVEGVMHGQGHMTFNSGDKYTGEFRNDVFHGSGVYRWADGDEYVGEYQHEKQHGEGTLHDAAGVYTGQWQDDQRNGHGKQVYSDGEVYEGGWLNDKKHGQGRQTMPNGSSYEGDWLSDKRHGSGVFRNSVGDMYEGEFLNSKAHGKGTYRWSDGTEYVGYFVDGVKHGEGCERRPDGTWVAGNWIEGEHDQRQPVHTFDQLEDHKRRMQEAMEQLDLATIQPLSSLRLVPPEGTTAASASPRQHAQAGFTEADFEDWRPMKILGKGSFGAVWEAQLRNGKTVCVKIVELGSLTDNDDLLALQNEINLMKRLHHPNIVRYFGCNEDKTKNTLNIFMECVTGGSVNHYIKKFKTLPIDTVREWACQIVSGVKYLHDCDIVHRDIKGDNILVTQDGVVKLADFGCSKQIDDVCSKSHGCKTMVGTPYWMAPEVIKCDSSGYGTRSDVWSVGCTVVEMVTGKPPWPECNSMWAAVYKIANSTGLPTEIPPDLDSTMMDFLERCFERDPKKRATAAELLTHTWIHDLVVR